MERRDSRIVGTPVGLLPLAGALLMAACTVPDSRGFVPREPRVSDVPSPNYESRDGQVIDLIVLHGTASAEDAWQIAEFFQNPETLLSVHYVIDRDGSIIRCVADRYRAWHAGAAEFDGATNINQRSIGIELCNLGDGAEEFSDAQVSALIRLMAWLSWTWAIPDGRFVRHRDVAIPPGRKVDPADNLDVTAVYRSVAEYRDTGRLVWPR